MKRAGRFARRWKYTLSVTIGIIIPSVIMLFFQITRNAGILLLSLLVINFITIGVGKIK